MNDEIETLEIPEKHFKMTYKKGHLPKSFKEYKETGIWKDPIYTTSRPREKKAYTEIKSLEQRQKTREVWFYSK